MYYFPVLSSLPLQVAISQVPSLKLPSWWAFRWGVEHEIRLCIRVHIDGAPVLEAANIHGPEDSTRVGADTFIMKPRSTRRSRPSGVPVRFQWLVTLTDKVAQFCGLETTIWGMGI